MSRLCLMMRKDSEIVVHNISQITKASSQEVKKNKQTKRKKQINDIGTADKICKSRFYKRVQKRNDVSAFSAYSYHPELTNYQLAIGRRYSGSLSFKILIRQYSPSHKYVGLSRPDYENLSLSHSLLGSL